jgi:putative intracellular protease/amidase
MSRCRLVGVFAVLLVITMGCAPVPAPATSAKNIRGKVLFIVEERSDNMESALTEEVGVMVSMLKETGFDTVMATASGQPLVGSATTLKPDLKLADVKADDYVGFMVPCMVLDPLTKPAAEVSDVMKKAVASGKPVAAQHGAVARLGATGVLQGKQFAMISPLQDLVSGGIYKGEGVVQDGNIITSGICPSSARDAGKPDGTAELTRKFIAALPANR